MEKVKCKKCEASKFKTVKKNEKYQCRVCGNVQNEKKGEVNNE